MMVLYSIGPIGPRGSVAVGGDWPTGWRTKGRVVAATGCATLSLLIIDYPSRNLERTSSTSAAQLACAAESSLLTVSSRSSGTAGCGARGLRLNAKLASRTCAALASHAPDRTPKSRRSVPRPLSSWGVPPPKRLSQRWESVVT